MSATKNLPTKHEICPWCKTPAAGHFCGNCKGPLSAVGTLLYSTNLLITLLAVPASLLFISYELSIQQQTASQSRDDQQKLVDAYGKFSGEMSEFAAAQSIVRFLGLGQQDVPKKDVQDAIFAADRAFVAIGAKLTPFVVVEAPDIRAKSGLEEVWENCFLYSYYMERHDGRTHDGYRLQLTGLLQSCQDGTCRINTVHEISSVLWKIGQQAACHDIKNVPQRDFGWIWHHLSLEISCVRSKDVRACLAEWGQPQHPASAALTKPHGSQDLAARWSRPPGPARLPA